MKKFFNLKMHEGGSMVKDLNSFNIVVNQLVSMGIKFEDDICTLILLASLPNIWKPMRTTITDSIGNAKLHFIDVRNTILLEEPCRKDYNEASISNSVLNVDNRGRSSERNSYKGNGNWGKSKNRREKLKNDRNLECWNCGKIGHLKKNYRAPRKNEDKINVAASVVIDEVRDALILSIRDSCDSWVLDLGALFHTTSQRDVLENYIAWNHGKV